MALTREEVQIRLGMDSSAMRREITSPLDDL
jgi:hypothetical protein